MSKQYLLGLDNGSTITKAALYNLRGDEITVSSVKVKSIMTAAGFVERNMDELWQANVKAIKNVIEAAGTYAEDL